MSDLIKISIYVFLIAFSTLILELSLIRVFDVVLDPNVAFMVITSAMFAFGLAGVYSTLYSPQKKIPRTKLLTGLGYSFAVFTLLLLPALNWIPFDWGQLSVHPILQLSYFLLIYLAISIPFFLSGLILTTIFSEFSSKIRSLYFFDLVGAGLGSIFLIPLLQPIGPGGIMFVIAALTLIATTLLIKKPEITIPTYVVALILMIAPFTKDDYFDFRQYVDKRGVAQAQQEDRIELTIWDPISKINIISRYKDQNSTELRDKHVAYDGGSQSSVLFPFSGDFDSLREDIEQRPWLTNVNFWDRRVLASHKLKEGTNPNVLIIGAAAGQETKAALLYGASHVDSVEMVGSVLEIAKNIYGDLIGNIYSHPNVTIHRDEGRSFLRKATSKYDIIQMFSNHTSSSIAAGSGAMAPAYLQTVDAYKEYFSNLSENGILHINHHVYPRMVATAAKAWKELSKQNFRDHVVVFNKDGHDSIPLLLIKMSPWTANEIITLTHYLIDERIKTEAKINLVENPLNPEGSFLGNSYYNGTIPISLEKNTQYRVSPPTDNKPFFNYLRKTSDVLEPDSETFLTYSTAALLNSQLAGDKLNIRIPLDTAHLYFTSFAAIIFSLIFILVPLLFSKISSENWHNRKPSLVYFSCLGIGFIMVELILVQLFMKPIGFPLYAYSVVIATMLIGAGSGSMFAEKAGISPQSRWWIPFAGTLIYGLIFILVHSYIFELILLKPILTRILLSTLLILPIGFFMGMPFPLGILAIKNKPTGAIAWAWAMNGLFTVVGGVMTIIIAINFGFKFTLIFGFLFYLIAATLMKKMRTDI